MTISDLSVSEIGVKKSDLEVVRLGEVSRTNFLQPSAHRRLVRIVLAEQGRVIFEGV